MQIGIDRIISKSDTITVFVCQIGVTRVGAGGRVLPRTRKGAMASVANLVFSTVEPTIAIETEKRPTPVRAVAYAARAVVTLALMVVTQPVAAAAMWTARTLLQAARAATVNAAFSMPVLATVFASWFLSTTVGTALAKSVMMSVLR